MYRVIVSQNTENGLWGYTIIKGLKHVQTSRPIYNTKEKAINAANKFINNKN